ncbi:MAG: SDR family NAD(P)-dependent oxidoreductase [Burkholderiales bacterium]|jgi:NAD(P)-dependent dehydrogenase (short-subunit alcohol dehydrogenase family)
MSEPFAGQSVLVAGGTGGLGRAVSLMFLQQGAKVAVTYQKQDEWDDLQQAAGQQVIRLGGHMLDVTNEPAVNQLVATIGALDVLVNTVGGYAGGAPVWETQSNVLEHMLALNLRSGFMLARAVIPGMLKRQRGAIVNVAAKAAIEHPAGAGAYAASKAAAMALLDSLAADVRGKGVRVNTILPSIIDTPANRAAMPKADFAKWPKPEQIARVVLFLCSAEAEVIHGAAIPVYGDS